MPDVFTQLCAGAVCSGTVLLLPTLGEILAERAGILNLGLEGMMIVGAFVGFVAAHTSGDPYLGLMAGALAGGLLSLLHALVAIPLRGNQTVSGLALTILGVGLTGFYGEPFQSVRLEAPLPDLPLPLLGDLPFLGPVFFQQDAVVYLALLLTPALWGWIYRTRPGLRLRAVGENARAAEALGLSVARTRLTWTFVGGLLAGLGGAYITVALHPYWLSGITAGKGWIAVALVVFAGWNPLWALVGAMLFGSVEALQLQLQAMGTYVNSAVLTMLPYLLTFLAVVGASAARRHRGGTPAELGRPFVKGER